MSEAAWPFWAPTPAAEIEQALDLAAVRPGEAFLDLGCGDGRVLLAAAKRGAVAVGYESDPTMAERARSLVAGCPRARVVTGDFYSQPLAADVVFAYLSPATLERLRPRLESLPIGTRVVTRGYRVSGWQPTAADGGSYLYRIPAERARAEFAPGWEHAGIVLALPPARAVLVPLVLGARKGAIRISADANLAGSVSVLAGAYECHEACGIPVDVRFEPKPEGTAVVGELLGTTGGADYRLTVAAVHTAERHSEWHVAPSSLQQLRLVMEEIRSGRRPAGYLFAAIAAGSGR